MSDHSRWENFVANLGGRERLEALIADSVLDPENIREPELWDELAVLYQSNPIARDEMRDIAAQIAKRSETDGVQPKG